MGMMTSGPVLILGRTKGRPFFEYCDKVNGHGLPSTRAPYLLVTLEHKLSCVQEAPECRTRTGEVFVIVDANPWQAGGELASGEETRVEVTESRDDQKYNQECDREGQVEGHYHNRVLG
jgi:hypothetical protein